MLTTTQIQDINRTMLGLGAPVEKDGVGYNKPDFSLMEGIGYLSNLDEIEALTVIETLNDYKNTQLRHYKDEIEETLKYYQDMLKSQFSTDDLEAEKRTAVSGAKHKKSDYEGRYLDFFGAKDGYCVVAFKEYIEGINIRQFNGSWVTSKVSGKTAIKIPMENMVDFLEYAKDCGRYGYRADEKLKALLAAYQATQQATPKVQEPLRLTPTGQKNQYGFDVYELNTNNYVFAQKLWNLKGTGVKYVDTKTDSKKTIISTTNKLLPKLLEFLVNEGIDISAVQDSAKVEVVDSNASGNTLIDATKLDLPFTPYPFQIEDAKAAVAKKRYLLGHDMGCIYADGTIEIIESGVRQYTTIKNLFVRQLKAVSNREKFDAQIKCLVNNEFKFMPVKRIISKGIRETVIVKTSFTSIECTPDHEFLTEFGWVEAAKLNETSMVYIYMRIPNSEFPVKANVISVTSGKKQRVYDIAIDDAEIHNFVCNGMVVHNCGKTMMSVMIGLSIKGKKLIICPETLRLNWKREILMAKKDANVTIIYSKDKTPEFADWTVMGYRTAVKFQKQIEQASITTMFVDEAHKCKAVNNFGKPDSKQAETVMSLSRQIEHVYLLTGTPMPTRNKDLFNELVILGELDDPKQNKWSFLKYAKEFCDGHKTAWGFDATGSSNTNELHRILKKYMVRRLKSEVLPNLTKQRIPIIIESKLSKDYLDIEKRLHEPDDGDTYMGLAMTGRRYLSKCKIDSAIEFAEDIVDNDESVVIVAEFDETLDALMEHFGDKSCCIRGGMSDTAKQKAIDEFQSGEKKVCCINLIAAGVGITLTKAHNMVIIDYDWTPSNMNQVEDRICRTGQNNHCNIYYIIHNDSTLDQIFLGMITEKSANIDRVVDDTENTMDLVSMRKNARDEDFFTRLKKHYQK